VGLIVLAIAIQAGDRSVLVPPPDARLEAFVRQLMARRADMTGRYLAEAVASRVDSRRLQLSYDRVEAGLGGSTGVETQLLRGDAEAAEVRAEIVGPRKARATLEFGLIWERGDWRIIRLPASW
jgi:hypothetical protein